MAGRGSRLVISTVEDGLVLNGSINGDDVVHFERALRSSVDGGGFVRLDMRRVGAMDVAALRVLVAESGRSRTQGGDVALDAPIHAIVDLVGRSGLAGVLTILNPGLDPRVTPEVDHGLDPGVRFLASA